MPLFQFKKFGKKLTVAVVLALACHCAASTPSAYAATLTVTSSADDGAGSLRATLATASAGDTINFAVSEVLLTTDQLIVDKSLTIAGTSAQIVTVRRSAADTTPEFRIFKITSGQTVNLSYLTISNGIISGHPGGGIYNDHGTLTLTNCTLSGNSTTDYSSGGIYNDGLDGTAILTLTNCTLSGNSAPNGAGGAIFNQGSGGTADVTLTNCTLSGNSAELGGAIYSDSFHYTANVKLTNCTLSGNSAALGGAIYNDGTGGSATVEADNTIFKKGTSGGNIFNFNNFGGTITSKGYNLSDDATGPDDPLTDTDRLNTDPLLGELANNGGPTQTHALLPGSPALNTGNTSLTTDQRGIARPQGTADDIGAFEVFVPTGKVLFTVTPEYNKDGGATLTYRLQNGTAQPLSSISVCGTLLVPVGDITASRGKVSKKLLNPRLATSGVTWNNFSLASGEEATLTVTLPAVPRKKALTLLWIALWKTGKNGQALGAASVFPVVSP